MNKFYDEIVFDMKQYNNDREAMWLDVSAQLQILLRAGYIAKIYADAGSDDMIVIQYHEQDEEIAYGTCGWITWDEQEVVQNEREQEVIMEDEEIVE